MNTLIRDCTWYYIIVRACTAFTVRRFPVARQHCTEHRRLSLPLTRPPRACELLPPPLAHRLSLTLPLPRPAFGHSDIRHSPFSSHSLATRYPASVERLGARCSTLVCVRSSVREWRVCVYSTIVVYIGRGARAVTYSPVVITFLVFFFFFHSPHLLLLFPVASYQ